MHGKNFGFLGFINIITKQMFGAPVIRQLRSQHIGFANTEENNKMYYWILFLGILAGLMKSIMDTIQFHRHSWIFDYIREHFGLAALEWFESRWKVTQNPWTHWIFGDGWHTAQNIMWASILVAIWISRSNWISVLAFYLGWALTFNTTFSFIFNKANKEYRSN